MNKKKREIQTNSESLEVIEGKIVTEEVKESILKHAAMAVSTEESAVSGGMTPELRLG